MDVLKSLAVVVFGQLWGCSLSLDTASLQGTAAGTAVDGGDAAADAAPTCATPPSSCGKCLHDHCCAAYAACTASVSCLVILKSFENCVSAGPKPDGGALVCTKILNEAAANPEANTLALCLVNECDQGCRK